MVGLPEHRSNAAHLKHQPLQCFEFAAVAAGQKFAKLAGQVQQNSARFKQAMGLPSGPLGSTKAGILLFGLIFRKSG
jgi:hypothetical protein